MAKSSLRFHSCWIPGDHRHRRILRRRGMHNRTRWQVSSCAYRPGVAVTLQQGVSEHLVIEDADPILLACAKMATHAVLLSVRPEVCATSGSSVTVFACVKANERALIHTMAKGSEGDAAQDEDYEGKGKAPASEAGDLGEWDVHT